MSDGDNPKAITPEEVRQAERRKAERRSPEGQGSFAMHTTVRAQMPDDDNPTLRMCIGRRLGGVRRLKKIGQAEVASHLGMSRPHLSNIELGRARTGWKGLRAMAEYYHLGFEQLLEDCSAKLAGETPRRATTEGAAEMLGGSKGVQIPVMLTDDEQFVLSLLRILATSDQRRIALEILELVRLRSHQIGEPDK